MTLPHIPPPQWVMLDNKTALRRVGERARALREARGLRQEDAAKKAGISKQTYCRFENTGRCTLATLIAVARALGVFGDLKILDEGDAR